MKKSNIVFLIIVGVLVFYVFNRLGDAYFCSIAPTALDKLNEVLENSDVILSKPSLVLYKNALLCGVGGVFCYFIAVVYFIFGRKNYLQGIEHGSAKWSA